MIREFLLLAIRSSVAYRLCVGPTPHRPAVTKRIASLPRPVPA